MCMPRILERLIFLMAGLTLAGCSGPSSGPHAAVVRDSAGVRIVEYTEFDGRTRLMDGTAPVLELGRVGSDPSREFYRVTAGEFLSDGSFVVVNAGSQELRRFDSAGAHIASFGSQGDGPGEFRRLSAVDVGSGDSIFAYDAGRRRVTVLTSDLELARIVTFQGEYRNLELGGVFSAGFLLVDNGYPEEEPTAGYQQFHGRYVLTDLLGAAVDTVGRYPWYRLQITESGTDLRGIRPFFNEPAARAASGDVFWIGTRQRHEIEGRDETGRLRLLLRLPARDLTVTPRDIDVWKEDRLEDVAPDQRDALREQMEAASFSDVFPAHGRLLTAPDGVLWLEEFRRPGDEGGQTWRVFDREGTLRGTVELSEGAMALAVSAGRVLVVERDELDVELVRVYSLIDADGGE